MGAVEKLDLDPKVFKRIQDHVFDNTGITLNSSKQELVRRRFLPRLKSLGLTNFEAYLDYLESNFDLEKVDFCNAITTNLTSFFRENHHYEFLANKALPELLGKSHRSEPLRIWSAGCSSGQEVYCLAITILRYLKGRSGDFKILGTDLDENCLRKGKQGIYSVTEMSGAPKEIIKEYFDKTIITSAKGREENAYQARDALTANIVFNKLNLMEPWPIRKNMDVIFCRNVFIYFNKDTQKAVTQNFAKVQKPGSLLFLGHSESINNPEEIGYKLIGQTVFRRI